MKRVALAMFMLLMVVKANAVIVELNKYEFLQGENITLKIYTSGNASLSIVNDTTVLSMNIEKSKTLEIPTSKLSPGIYKLYIADRTSEFLKDIKIKSFKAHADVSIKSKISGKVVVLGETNIPNGYKLKIRLNSVEKEVEVNDGKFEVSFDVPEGIYNLKVIFGSLVLNETKVYVEKFKIESVKAPSEIYVGEPITIIIKTNAEFFTRVVLQNESYMLEKTARFSSLTGEIEFDDLWLKPGDYSISIAVNNSKNSDYLKLPLEVQKSFLDVKVESFDGKKAKLVIFAPSNHRIWVIGYETKKIVMGEDRKRVVDIAANNSINVVDQMNLAERDMLKKLESNDFESLPHLTINPKEKSNEKTSEMSETSKSDTKGLPGLFAGSITIAVIGGILVALFFILRREV
ncbi:hypothetical protein Asulf_01972 [Archaeoglobus sulfaticallidus PM70-1]|uniref:Uncharacterized protein n=1 Tax=Archaeoglobus sulfaticallidus PM70-1 TaxID=387631 RepID=N0BFY7_9EURY|nr:hypothetical protein [Archaeoglobus sulfaticallidus]AGK61938.1 hypothetical protein Asulf_01972 [Archaeoglobus sulfaticallidus PM70-1]